MAGNDIAMSSKKRLSDHYLPHHHFSERHWTMVRGDAAAIHDRVAAFDPLNDPLVARIMALREWPRRMLDKAGPTGRPFGLTDFTLLERGPHDSVYGLVGRFWRFDFGLADIPDADAFLAYDRPGTAKLVLSFETEPSRDGAIRLVTRTRIFCPDRGSRLRFTPYWYAIRPVSGFLRRRMLNQIRLQVEGSGKRG